MRRDSPTGWRYRARQCPGHSGLMHRPDRRANGHTPRWLCGRSFQHALPSRSEKDEGARLRVGHHRPQFVHSGLRRARDHYQGRTREQCLLQGEDHEHRPAQARSLTAAVWRIPHAAVRLCLPGGHLRGTPAIRGNLSERADGCADAGSVPRTRRRHAEGAESSQGQSIGSEHDAQYAVAVSRSPLWDRDAAASTFQVAEIALPVLLWSRPR